MFSGAGSKTRFNIHVWLLCVYSIIAVEEKLADHRLK